VFGALALSAGALGLVAVFAAVSFDPDIQPVGYVAQPAVSSFIVSTGTQKMYAADYSSLDWSGNLHSYNLSDTGTIANVNGVETDNWVGGAAAKINAQNFDTGRNIVTFSGTAGVPFRWSNLSTAQKATLDNGTLATATTSPILNYIRGDISKQANQTVPGPYRTRTNVLGDIIHSTPVHWNDGTNKTVFVGANDGMLHAINADDGTERFAYIPSMLMPKLGQLSNPAYTHKYYVDGRLDVRKFGTQTLLVGALGAGGRGLFGLDVTNAAVASESEAASKILWEISNTSAGFANLGYTYGAPTLFTLPNGTKAVAVGNGYNSTGTGTTAGQASLFLINASTGALINEIGTGVGTAASPNGLSTPTLWDTDNDGKIDTAYAGDIDGNLWKFNLTTNVATKLHTTSPAQAITTAPSVIKHPLGGHMVNFVTGRLLTPGDKTDNATHYAYGIWDGAPTGNNTLLVQTLTERSYTSGSITTRVRTATNNLPDWFATHKGWKTALPTGGERLVGDGALVNDSVFMFLSTNPTVLTTATPPGENWWMQLNALTGGDNGTVQFDLNKDGAYTATDEVTVGTESLKPVGRYFGGGIRSQLLQLSVKGGNYVFQSSFDKNGTSSTPLPPDTTNTTVTNTSGRGVSGGHFDEDIYYGSASFPTSGKGTSQLHVHEYDDKFDVTGVNMLNASNVGFNLANAIPLATTQFKVLAQNQYLSPAVNIHIKGNPSYVYNLDQGYIPIKNFNTSATLDVTDVNQVPTYNRNSINSLAINMPVDAFAQKDWWGGALGLPADVRVGLHPTQTGCVKESAGSTDGNMYQPVIPPTAISATENGTLGYNSSTTPATATGVRHNGALVIQIIKANTPNTAIEMSVPGNPQYGWRVKSANVAEYVLAEYTTFWHNKIMGKCYGEAGWTKLAPQDPNNGSAGTAATGSTDPKIGAFGGVPVSTTPGTLTYPPVTTTVVNTNGTTTTTTVTVTVKTNSDGSTTTTTKTDTKTTFTNGNGESGSGGGVTTGGAVDGGGSGGGGGGGGGIPPCTIFVSGVCGPGNALGRINWRELQR
jgi:hypothetical protein